MKYNYYIYGCTSACFCHIFLSYSVTLCRYLPISCTQRMKQACDCILPESQYIHTTRSSYNQLWGYYLGLLRGPIHSLEDPLLQFLSCVCKYYYNIPINFYSFGGRFNLRKVHQKYAYQKFLYAYQLFTQYKLKFRPYLVLSPQPFQVGFCILEQLLYQQQQQQNYYVCVFLCHTQFQNFKNFLPPGISRQLDILFLPFYGFQKVEMCTII